MSHEKGLATKAIHSYKRDEWSWKPVILPIVPAMAFEYGENAKSGEFSYSRYGNPTVSTLEKTIAALDDAKYGVCFSSGMASLVAIVQLLRPGDHIVCSEVVYGGTTTYLKDYVANMDIEISVVDCGNIPLLEKSIKKNTKYVILEVLSNPALHMLDVGAISQVTAKYKNILLVVDNTFLTPVFLKPLTIGADIVFHSLTKYMNGHGDIMMGAVITNNDEVYKNLKLVQSGLGSVPSPFDCYMVSRSLKTLRVRMREHASNAETVAKFLEGHDSVEKVLYPGLPSHPQHELAKRILKGYGGMVAVTFKGGPSPTYKFINNLKIFTNTGTLGLVESIASHPWSVSHAVLQEDEKIRLGITENMVRLSIGLEDATDLIEDLAQALENR